MKVLAQLARWRRLFWLAVGAVVLFGADMGLAKYGPATWMATIETGASFSVSAGSFATESRAATFAAALDASGLPVILRTRTDDGRQQVLVGPYISTDEAEHAQRKLAAWGLGEARLVVDDTMRARPQEAAMFGFGESASNSVVMLAAPRMASIVFEMHAVPKEVELRRTSGTSLEVAIGRTQPATALEPLSLPDGVSLVRELSVGSEAGAMSAHVVVPTGVASRLRLEGRRVYLDLAFEQAPWTVPHVAPPAEAPAAPITAASRPLPDDRAQIDAAVARLHQIEPFLSSAIANPEPEVAAALSHTVADLRGAVEKLRVSENLEGERLALLAMIGDRAEALRKATAGLRETGAREWK